MVAPALIATATAGVPSGTTLSIPVPVGAANGDVLVALIRGQGVSTGTTQASCSGWTPRHGQGLNDRVHMILTHQVSTTAEPASYTFATNGASGRIVGAIQLWRGVDPANPVAGFHDYTKIPGTSQTLSAWSVDSATDTVAAIGLWSDERTSGQSYVPTSTPSSWTTGVNVQSTLDASTSGSRTSIWSGYSVASGSTTIPDATLVMPSGATSPNGSAIALRGAAGAPVVEERTAVGALTLSGRGTPYQRGFASVDEFLNTRGATSAWRLGGGPYPQISEYAADQSIALGYKALEFSCGWTSDLVPFGLGPQYLDSIAGVSGNVDPTTMTWATLSATYVNKSNPVAPGVYQPFYRLADALAKYAADCIMLVDPKYGFDTTTKIDAMLDLCDANGGPSRIIIKFDSPTSSTVLTTRAHARGYRCMSFWGTDQTTLAAQQGNWDILGVDRTASQTMFDAAKSYGKPVWAAVTASQAEYDTALARGADFQNVSAVTSVPPVGPAPSATATGVTSLSGAAASVEAYARMATATTSLHIDSTTFEAYTRSAGEPMILSADASALETYARTSAPAITLSGSVADLAREVRIAAGGLSIAGVADGEAAGGTATRTAEVIFAVAGVGEAIGSVTEVAAVGSVALAVATVVLVQYVRASTGDITLSGRGVGRLPGAGRIFLGATPVAVYLGATPVTLV